MRDIMTRIIYCQSCNRQSQSSVAAYKSDVGSALVHVCHFTHRPVDPKRTASKVSWIQTDRLIDQGTKLQENQVEGSVSFHFSQDML
ncbi:hypothetical protein MPTK1_5g23480 [Marchantia polymorpha subsp. ruderalis]|uniref:Uncharacterized protein n=2 Tax=Marchantia polymorpha TaxID=3197 RepID=A0AAF6BLH5_MARPO|nr:hypothetical protein MARPO_0010s0109 [Marchantia polymorpha]BBN12859.1 hypothetical protein Mp_5g23480 [Marchantia polymorpha subsp. ruderalis]|eukprot:PTQ46717.1 hypothetical protein MARPO_0010s0109 [Marchantia polymorpha]